MHSSIFRVATTATPHNISNPNTQHKSQSSWNILKRLHYTRGSGSCSCKEPQDQGARGHTSPEQPDIFLRIIPRNLQQDPLNGPPNLSIQ